MSRQRGKKIDSSIKSSDGIFVGQVLDNDEGIIEELSFEKDCHTRECHGAQFVDDEYHSFGNDDNLNIMLLNFN